MILRRIADAIRRQDLATISIELLVLIVGIALALQVDQWNAERQERRLEQTLIERLSFDFEQIENRLSDSIERYNGYLASIEHVREVVRSGQPPEPGDARARFLLALGDILGSRIPAGRSPTYVEMLSSGAFDVLENDALKRSLVDYDQRQGIAMAAWNSLRDQSLAYSEPIMYSMTLVPPADETGNINPGAFDFERMQTDPAFDGALGVQISVQANNRSLQNFQLDSARTVLEQLRVNQESDG